MDETNVVYKPISDQSYLEILMYLGSIILDVCTKECRGDK